MSLLDYLQYLIKIWAVTLDMTVMKTVNMLLEEKRKGEKPKFPEEKESRVALANVTRSITRNEAENGARRPPCKTCDKMYRPVCYIEHSELTSEWYHEMIRGTKRKRIETEAHAAFAYSF